ncbi:hypothetical protein NQ314_016468 [Rhamnusium bicolor]|uniref:deoxyribose-phosphate aldolase n=1 Tax=Rhamnusium bicolor TaxID=1586634 RepID=A0AAV8WW42_9CUCU|nr:hypothetical protein NQ314_016468 [Rhamnusium bicolor]
MMIPERNPGCELDLGWINSVNVNLTAVNEFAKKLSTSRELKNEYRAAWLLKAVTCIDLTTLAGDDTHSNIARLCFKAAKPIAEDLLNELGFEYNNTSPIHTAAVCVYPSKVQDAVETLKYMGLAEKIKVASVATGFPSGQTPLKTRLEEIRYAVEKGAKEIDIVIDRSLVLTGKWETLYQEIQQMKEACGPHAHMKAILATGELGTLDNVGLKPAGGVRNAKDALSWLILVKELLGHEWLNPELFRFGASGLLGDLECNLYEYVTGKYPAAYEFSMG